MSARVDVLAALTSEQAHEMAPKSFSWDEAGAWMVGYNACADKHRAAVAEYIRDAERYRWLRGSPKRKIGLPCAYVCTKGHWYPMPIGDETLDAAIDAAVAGNTEPQP